MHGAPLQTLQRVPLFADLSSEELERIAGLFQERRFGAGETVVQEGSDGATLYVIDSGEASVSINGHPTSILKPGDYFGEIALIDQGTRLATVTASGELICFGISYLDFRPLVKANGEIGWKLLQRMAALLRDTRAMLPSEGSTSPQAEASRQ